MQSSQNRFAKIYFDYNTSYFVLLLLFLNNNARGQQTLFKAQMTCVYIHVHTVRKEKYLKQIGCNFRRVSCGRIELLVLWANIWFCSQGRFSRDQNVQNDE